MSKTKDFMHDLYEIEALETQLKNQLNEAQFILAELFNKREKAIRLINKQRFDLAQYRLDDLQQMLSDVSEELIDISATDTILTNLIAP